jgi:fucose permease
MKGYLTIFSGFIWMLYVGSHFMIGNIVPYIESYFVDATKSQSETVFSMLVFITIFSNFAGSNLLKKKILAPRTIIGIGGVVGIGGCFVASLTTNWTIFRILFPLSYGFAVGFTYMVHLYLAW